MADLSESLPPHMLYPDVWRLSDQYSTPHVVVNFIDWIREEPDRLVSFHDAMFKHALGRFVVIIGTQFDDSGEMTHQVEFGMYLDGLIVRDDKHNHLRGGRAFIVAADPLCRFHSDYYFPLPPEAPDFPGLDIERN